MNRRIRLRPKAEREALRYRRTLWVDARSDWRDEIGLYMDATSHLDVEGKRTNRSKIICKLCDAVVFGNIDHNYWMKYLHTKEQRHINSAMHQQNLLLDKLGGE